MNNNTRCILTFRLKNLFPIKITHIYQKFIHHFISKNKNSNDDIIIGVTKRKGNRNSEFIRFQ